jgi:hypothetical protein
MAGQRWKYASTARSGLRVEVPSSWGTMASAGTHDSGDTTVSSSEPPAHGRRAVAWSR